MSNSNYSSEQELVSKLSQKDQEAFERLYDDYSPALYGVIYRILKQEEIASEVLQDTFLKIWQKAGQFDPQKGKLFTWMINIARNTAIDKLRSKEISQGSKTDLNVNYVHMKVEHPKDENVGVRDLLHQLDKDQKQVLEMIYFGGYTHAEASEELNIPLGTVKTRVRNGLIQLRQFFNLS